jgi:hypothetical protein
MADPIREQILETIKIAMASISIASGYQQDVQGVYRSGEATLNIDENPSVLIIDRGDVQKKHIRGAYENRMQVDFKAIVREGDDAKRLDLVHRLLADIQKIIVVNEGWAGLAKKTWLRSSGVGVGELQDPLAVDTLSVEIMYRVERANPFVNTEI